MHSRSIRLVCCSPTSPVDGLSPFYTDERYERKKTRQGRESLVQMNWLKQTTDVAAISNTHRILLFRI